MNPETNPIPAAVAAAPNCFDAYDTQDIWQKDKDHFVHPWTDLADFKEKGSLVVAESEGACIYDSDGNKFLDGIGGLWCGIVEVQDELISSGVWSAE